MGWKMFGWAAVLCACSGPGGSPDGGTEPCVVDEDCDEGIFCNGQESCVPGSSMADERGCVPAMLPPCREGQTCDEGADRCVTDCDVTIDADGDGHAAIECLGDDCDDGDANRFPGNPEVCDVFDHDEDCDPRTFGFRDQDMDGIADALCCNEGDGGRICGPDCNDNDASAAPAQPEVCDEVDNDCDGGTDEGVATEYWPDMDGDGFGDPMAETSLACSVPPGFADRAGDCDDDDPAENGAAPEVCDERDNDCDGSVDEGTAAEYYPDADGDGFGDASAAPTVTCRPPTGSVDNSGDCDDSDPARNGAAPEICDEVDNDCDGTVDEGIGTPLFRDADGDGFGERGSVPTFACGTLEGYVANQGDCDDGTSQVSPAGIEVCDGLDNDCSGAADEGLTLPLWPDADRDGFGDESAASAVACPREGYVANGNDCDDTRPEVRPGLSEICDGLDNDCSGAADEGLLRLLFPDGDGDGDGDDSVAGMMRCPAAGWVVANGDCDDSNRLTFAGAPELCDEADNDCDATVDEDTSQVAWYADGDGDGFGDPASVPVLDCSPVAGRSQLTECDDSNADVYPGAPQLCDRIQNDCSLANPGGSRPAEDSDGDGHSAPGAPCSGGFPKDDCDDSRAATYPGAWERCNRLDDDCSLGGGTDPAEDMDGDRHSPPTAACTGGAFPKDDCDDTRATIYTGAPELCDRVDNDCSSGGGNEASEDADRDGHAPVGASCSGGFPRDDCRDTLPLVYGGAPERCNRFDDDCSMGGGLDASEDADDDGYASFDAACAGVRPRTDCDDALADRWLCQPTLATTVTTFDDTREISAGLLGGDRLPDLSINRGNGFTFELEPEHYRNDGSSSWPRAGTAVLRMALGDFDGDGDLDTVRGTAAMRVFFDGAPGPILDSDGAAELAVRDVNRDGIDDVVTLGVDLELHLGNGDGTFRTIVVAANQGAPEDYFVQDVAIADINGDLRPDIVWLGTSGISGGEAFLQLRWSRNQGAGSTSWSLPIAHGPDTLRDVWMAAGDVDQDGFAEVYLAHVDAPSVAALEWNGAGFVDAGFPILDRLGTTGRIEIADLDGDGDLELVKGQGFVEVVSPGTARIWGGPTSGRDVAVADFDDSGDLDLATVDLLGDAFAVWLLSGGPFGRDGQTSCTCYGAEDRTY